MLLKKKPRTRPGALGVRVEVLRLIAPGPRSVKDQVAQRVNGTRSTPAVRRKGHSAMLPSGPFACGKRPGRNVDVHKQVLAPESRGKPIVQPAGRVAEMQMRDKTEQSDRAPNPNEKPESCYCSALPKGSGPCLPCYT